MPSLELRWSSHQPYLPLLYLQSAFPSVLSSYSVMDLGGGIILSAPICLVFVGFGAFSAWAAGTSEKKGGTN